MAQDADVRAELQRVGALVDRQQLYLEGNLRQEINQLSEKFTARMDKIESVYDGIAKRIATAEEHIEDAIRDAQQKRALIETSTLQIMEALKDKIVTTADSSSGAARAPGDAGGGSRGVKSLLQPKQIIPERLMREEQWRRMLLNP